MDEQRFEKLINNLSDYDELVRWQAVEELGESGDYRAFAVLRPLLEDDDYVSSSLWQALLKIDPIETSILLLQHLYKVDERRRREIIECLNASNKLATDFPFASQFAAIALELLADKRRLTRAEAATMLGRIGDERAFDALLVALDAEGEREGAGAAEEIAAALRKLAGSRAFDLRGTALLDRLEDTTAQIRVYAAAALAGLGDPRALEALAAHVRDHSKGVCNYVFSGLEQMGEAGMLKLLELANDEDKAISGRALSSLAEFKDERVVAAALKAMDDPELMLAATSTLATVAPQQAVAAIIERILHSSNDVQDEWLSRLDCIAEMYTGYQTIAPYTDLLIDLLNTDNKEALTSVMRILCGIGEPRALSLMIPLLRSEDADIRAAAVSYLRGKNSPLTLDILAPMLADKDITVQHRALRAIGEMADSRAVDLLIPRLSAEYPNTLFEVATALGMLRDERAVTALIQIAQHENPKIRFAVALALGRIGNPRALPTLQMLANEPPIPGWRMLRQIKDQASIGVRHIRRKTQVRDAKDF